MIRIIGCHGDPQTVERHEFQLMKSGASSQDAENIKEDCRLKNLILDTIIPMKTARNS